MNEKLLVKQKVIFTAIVSLVLWLLLIFDHFNGGVSSHHILNKKELPEISNWWGGILLPILTWFLLSRVDKRLKKNNKSNLPKSVYYGFGASLSFGIALSAFFSFGYSNISGIMIQSVLLMALFYPIYQAECLLGFVLGMTFTFGAVLPTGIGAILALISTFLYLFIRPHVLFLFSKIIQNSPK